LKSSILSLLCEEIKFDGDITEKTVKTESLWD